MADLTIEFLKRLMHYNKKTGHWTWLIDWSGVKKGQRAGYINSKGYVVIKVGGTPRYAHRLAIFYVTGKWPPNHVDHKNDIKSDNCWKNIRSCTCSQNHAHKPIQKNNRSGYKGVSWNKGEQKWVAYMKANGKRLHFGYFDKKELAAAAYAKAAKEHYGKFARLK